MIAAINQGGLGGAVCLRAGPLIFAAMLLVGCGTSTRTAEQKIKQEMAERGRRPVGEDGYGYTTAYNEPAILAPKEVARLIPRAETGDGAAAHRLSVHYEASGGRENFLLALNYAKLALKYEYPPTLYGEAVRAWDTYHDQVRADRFLKRALELGYKESGEGLAQDMIKATGGIEPTISSEKNYANLGAYNQAGLLDGATVAALRAKADRGDGAAAYRLYLHYGREGMSAAEKGKYGRLTIEYEYPPVLYVTAVRAWDLHHDRELAEKLLKQAMDLGLDDISFLEDELSHDRLK